MNRIVENHTSLAREDIPQLQAKLKGKEGTDSELWRVFRIIEWEPLKIESLAECKDRESAKALLSRFIVINNELKLG